jgi:sorting nexin-29
LFETLQPYVEKVIGSYQCGFRSGKSTSDQMHMVRHIMEKMGEYGVSTFYLFVDFKAAYDSINGNELFMAMDEFALPGKLRRLVEVTLENVRRKVKTQNGISAPFITRKGLRQGDALSCNLTLP